MRCILAIDSGGTKTDALLVRDDGTALRWGHGEMVGRGAERSFGGSGRSRSSIAMALRGALGTTECEELHLFSVSGWLPVSISERLGIQKVIMRGVQEHQAVLALVGETVGAIVHAGTGAFVYGKLRDGRSLRLDGLGPMLGDYGGAYHIGMLALRAVAKSGWHPRHETSLAEPVLRACGGRERDRFGYSLIKFTQTERDRAEIASLAKIVDAEANAGDRIARAILEEAAASIAETLRDLVDRLGIALEDYALVGAGSVITRSDLYWKRLVELAREIAPGLRPLRLTMRPVVGIALLGLQELQAGDPQALRENLLRSATELMGSWEGAGLPDGAPGERLDEIERRQPTGKES